MNTMFSSAKTGYSTRWANLQKNSFTPHIPTQGNKLVWKKTMSEVTGKNDFNLHYLLQRNGLIGIKDEYFLFFMDYNGSLTQTCKLRNDSYSCPVVLGDKAVAYFSNGQMLNYVDYAGNIIVDSEYMTGREEWSFVRNMLPTEDTLVLANQFSGGPAREPKRYFVCRQPIGKFDWTWEFAGDGEIQEALFSQDCTQLILIMRSEVVVLDCISGKEISRFNISIPSVETASLAPEGKLIVLGADLSGKMQLQCYGLSNGGMLWEYGCSNPSTHQPPSIDSSGTVYLFNDSLLQAITDGELAWESPETGIREPLITICGDNSVLLVNGCFLLHLDSEGTIISNELLTVDLTEEFSLPAIVNEHGRIFVANDRNIYSYE